MRLHVPPIDHPGQSKPANLASANRAAPSVLAEPWLPAVSVALGTLSQSWLSCIRHAVLQSANLTGRTSRLLAALGLVSLVLPIFRTHAFPPAPHHLIFGTIRDELGNPLAAGAAQVILETTSGVRTLGGVRNHGSGVNYHLAISMDAGITSKLYKPTALRPFAPFKIKVRIGREIYVPIEMTSDLSKLGVPGKETRIDLTLGIDADGDGLPDAWERALLRKTGGQGLDSIKPEGDLDGDGVSNLNEYLAGTYAYDPKDGFSLRILEVEGAESIVEFVAVAGRTYTILGSADLGNWAPISFRLGSDSQPRNSLQSTAVTLIRASVADKVGEESMRFFKLMVH